VKGLCICVLLAVEVLNTAAFAGPIIKCQSNNHSNVFITLNARKQFGHTLNCISGDFVADMTPCAPNGGFGLSYPTGTAALSRVVKRWQDYGDHFGGVASNNISETRMTFSGGFMSSQGFEEKWDFIVDRTTGKATLKMHADKPSLVKTIGFECIRAQRKI